MAFRSASLRWKWLWKDIWPNLASRTIQNAATKQENHRCGVDCEDISLRIMGAMDLPGRVGWYELPGPSPGETPPLSHLRYAKIPQSFVVFSAGLGESNPTSC